MSKTVWVATADIYVGSGASFVRGYTPASVVPDSVVAALGIAESGLVRQTNLPDVAQSPDGGDDANRIAQYALRAARLHLEGLPS